MSSRRARKTTLMILLDAFSKTYFSKKDTPFLYDLSQDGMVTHIDPLFAFKGIETTIFTGVWPNIHNVWTEFCFRKKQVDSKRNSLIRRMIIEAVDLLSSDSVRAKSRYAIERYLFRNTHRTPSLMPAVAMAFFATSQKKEITEPGAVGNVRTVFDYLRERRVQFVFNEPWIMGDRGVLYRVKKLIKQEHKCQFWYLKFNDLDHLGHKFGPTPFAFKDQLLKIDTYVEEIVVSLRRKKPNLNVLVLSDHGMSRVYKTINLLEGLSCLDSEMYKDYVVFVDSTMARFWFSNEKARQEICSHLGRIRCGHIVTKPEKNSLKMPLDTKYGQIIFVVDEGCVLHPCFFHSKSLVNGMHGYAYPKTAEALPIMVMNREITNNFQINKQVVYPDIARLILNSLFPKPSTTHSV